jgi:hypothetical protein
MAFAISLLAIFALAVALIHALLTV